MVKKENGALKTITLERHNRTVMRIQEQHDEVVQRLKEQIIALKRKPIRVKKGLHLI